MSLSRAQKLGRKFGLTVNMVTNQQMWRPKRFGTLDETQRKLILISKLVFLIIFNACSKLELNISPVWHEAQKFKLAVHLAAIDFKSVASSWCQVLNWHLLFT